MSENVLNRKMPGDLLGAEIQAAVKAELELMLGAAAFSQSTRCKSFLSHVVLNALAGNTDQLKERIIGITVFGRPNDYNTGDDSIVRVTANEVRKRIGQFYQESETAQAVQIELPRGTYMPEFRIRPAGRSTAASAIAAPAPAHRGHEEGDELSPEPKPLVSPVLPELPGSSLPEGAPEGGSAKRLGTQSLWLSISVLALLLVTLTITYGIARTRGKKQVPDIWGPFLGAKQPVLLCLGTHDIADPSAKSPSIKGTFSDLVLHREVIPIDDLEALTSIEKLLGKRGISFHVAGSEQVSLADLQKQPVILIGAVGNQWTLRLTQGLRYRITADWPSGPDGPPVASIVDSDEPQHEPWKIDFSVPVNQWKNDYAILAREEDASIGVPVLIVAGLGSFGTLAASEVIHSSAFAQAFASDRSCKGKSNFEAVIGASMTGTQAGPPHVLRETCW